MTHDIKPCRRFLDLESRETVCVCPSCGVISPCPAAAKEEKMSETTSGAPSQRCQACSGAASICVNGVEWYCTQCAPKVEERPGAWYQATAVFPAEQQPPAVNIRVQPGSASAEDIKAFLDALSHLQVALGGTGLKYDTIPPIPAPAPPAKRGAPMTVEEAMETLARLEHAAGSRDDCNDPIAAGKRLSDELTRLRARCAELEAENVNASAAVTRLQAAQGGEGFFADPLAAAKDAVVQAAETMVAAWHRTNGRPTPREDLALGDAVRALAAHRGEQGEKE